MRETTTMTDAAENDESVTSETSGDKAAGGSASAASAASAGSAGSGTAGSASAPAPESARAEEAGAEAGSAEAEPAEGESAEGAVAPTGVKADLSKSTPAATESSAGSTASRGPDKGFIAVAVIAVLSLVAAIVLGVLWATDDSADELAALQSRLEVEAAAEAAAARYALRVSEVDHRDLDAWRAALTEGVTAQLAPKLDAAVDVVGPWLSQMEYTATARLLAADLSEAEGDRYVVQVFVDMTSKSKQTPDGVAATATYTVTLDRASDWTITDVGGVGGGLPGATTPPTGGR